MSAADAVTPEVVLAFWFDEVAPEQQFKKDPELDRTIAERFGAARDQGLAGALDDWPKDAQGALALIVLLDQFSRNLFRDDPRAFEADAKARGIAARAIDAGFDKQVTERQRPFFYLPFMHSEDLADQDRCIELFGGLPDNKNGMHHAEQHREVIARFGRFPYRNQALGRESTKEEEEYLASGGYVP